MPQPPKKKKCSRSKKTLNKENARSRRNEETPEERNRRLESNRVRTAASRAQETDEERERRLEVKRISVAASRAEETDEERERRLEVRRISVAASRAEETDEERERRLEVKRISVAASRAEETDEERERRLEVKRISVAATRIQIWREKENSAFMYDPQVNYMSDAACAIGSMMIMCEHCSAMKWRSEAPGLCCSNGKVQLPLLTDPPQILQSLFTDDSPDAKHFQNNIRLYNSCFQMTSFGATKIVRESGYMPTFKIQGQVYHLIGSVHPLPNEEPKFLQVYFISDEMQQAEQRCRNVPRTKTHLVMQLQDMLQKENGYVRSFKMAIEKSPPELTLVISADKTPVGEHQRRFNAPMTSDVGIIICGERQGNRDILLDSRNNNLQRISEIHRSYDTLQYPLLFWKGEDGYHLGLQQTNPSTGLLSNKRITALEFYAFMVMVRSTCFNIILKSKDLFQQYLVDMYAKIETQRLRYIQHNQKQLRVEDYAHLQDAVNNDGNINDIGKLIILPSSFTGSPRYMHERTQDAMTYVRNFGRPDLFITFTCNPNWEEIKNELFPGQKPQDRHDLIARVFHLKCKKMVNLITKAKIFGSVQCFIYTIEWQKRGLPHVHILVWLKEKIHAQQVDEFISAEIPDREQDPELFKCITTQMVHGPCGLINSTSPCMKDGKCSKRYPRNFLRATVTGIDGYPLYRRRSPEDGGHTAILKIRGSDMLVDNRWIVPYCPLLCKIFNAHINVEFCNSIKSIKYVCKYVNKGSDMAIFQVTNPADEINEVQMYQMGRYISSNEAAWRILEFPIHERYPTVIHLSVHLENGQRVYFTTENAVEQVQTPRDTTLTAFFKLCMEDEFARSLLYHEVPKYYTWNSHVKKWNRRKNGVNVPDHPGIKCSDAIGRVYTVHPNNSECFHLRLLMHEVRGPTSFSDLKTVQEQVCATFKEACQVRGLLLNDEQWNATLEEAALTRSPNMMRNLLAIMLHTCAIANPLQLWVQHKENLSEDILHRERNLRQNPELHYDDTVFNKALIMIEDKILSFGGSDLQSYGLPQPTRRTELELPAEYRSEISYDPEQLDSYLQENEPKLVDDQKEAYEKITTAIFNGSGGIFFLDAPGGTGKTFLINLLLAKVRQQNHIALAVASSGIAATLLTSGRTAHSTFKLPLNLHSTERPTCNISKGSGKAKVLQGCKLIVWDECTMSHKTAFEALDITLRDLRNNNIIMGGITVLLAGDFRQILPVIQRGTRADEMNACIKASYIWNHIQKLRLRTNMRVHLTGDVNAKQFAAKLLQLGNGLLTSDVNDGCISMEGIGNIVHTHEDLLQAVFPNLPQHFIDHTWLCERAILCPRNESVTMTNNALLNNLPGTLHIYKSIDVVCDREEVVNYPTEF